MELIHKGFDALDLAFMVNFPPEQVQILERAKAKALSSNQDALTQLGGVDIWVAPTGGRGGYAFRFTTGTIGQIWFVKRPRRSDPWGIRVSVSAALCALAGLAGVKERLEDTLVKFNLPARAGSESISRVDYAVDFLMPDFELSPQQFVMHSKTSYAKHASMPIETYREGGQSGRTQTVMIGKNPNRQVIIYDKRAEVLKTRKSHWPEIWNLTRKREGKPPLDLKDRDASQIWRVELRAYKKHLKDDWKVSSWGTLQSALPRIFERLTDDIRYTVPGQDQNRSRWPNHPLWDRVREEVRHGLLTARSFASADVIREASEAELQRMLREQAFGCLITLAAIKKTPADELANFFAQQNLEFEELLRQYPKQAAAKLAKARAKYG